MAKKQVKRIVLTGAQGTGKTTLMNELAKDGTRTLSIARETAKKLNWPVETDKIEKYQKTLFNTMKKSLSSKRNYISDRSLICVAAHSYLEALNENISNDLANEQYLNLQKFHKDNPDILVVYVPIEFEIENDGVRNTDKYNQIKIDTLIKNILTLSKIEYITVRGTVEERLSQIQEALNK